LEKKFLIILDGLGGEDFIAELCRLERISFPKVGHGSL
jgi:hypothetical protein